MNRIEIAQPVPRIRREVVVSYSRESGLNLGVRRQ